MQAEIVPIKTKNSVVLMLLAPELCRLPAVFSLPVY
jgi:hypothetical protein